MSERRRSWTREPLLHFVLLGAAIFALDAGFGERTVEAREDEIVVSPERVENLIALFAKTWRRAPTPAELQGLVRDHALEEALYREGLALGLDRDDVVVRRRLRQKMEFLVEDVVELAEPTEEDLEAWLAEHAADYAEPGELAFRQVHLSPTRRGDALQADAEELLAVLRADPGVDAAALGDPTLLAHVHEGVTPGEVDRTFGEGFAAGLLPLELGTWAGPFESAYGLHLVRVDERTSGRHRPLDEVRDQVARDWSFAQREEATERYHESLLERYRVRVEWPEDLVEAGLKEGLKE